MKLGVLTTVLGSLDYEEMLARVVEAGLEAKQSSLRQETILAKLIAIQMNC